MYCKNCGKNISDDAKFCQFCGCRIDGYQELYQNTDNPSVNPQYDAESGYLVYKFTNSNELYFMAYIERENKLSVNLKNKKLYLYKEVSIDDFTKFYKIDKSGKCPDKYFQETFVDGWDENLFEDLTDAMQKRARELKNINPTKKVDVLDIIASIICFIIFFVIGLIIGVFGAA